MEWFATNSLTATITELQLDLDMLEVGNTGLTAAEQQTHFAFWAAAKYVTSFAVQLPRL